MRATVFLAALIATVAGQTVSVPTSTKATPTTTPRWFNVSVVGDATYSIPGPICSGAGLAPAGVKCPVKGDKAVASCHKGLKTWGVNGTCVAPVDAVCQKIPSGAWGCVWGNATAKPTTTVAPTTTVKPTTTVAPTTTAAPVTTKKP